MTGVDVDEIYEQLHTVSVRRDAERLRLEATRLAAEYERLVDRGLDRAVLAQDRAAVLRAWQAIR